MSKLTLRGVHRTSQGLQSGNKLFYYWTRIFHSLITDPCIPYYLRVHDDLFTRFYSIYKITLYVILTCCSSCKNVFILWFGSDTWLLCSTLDLFFFKHTVQFIKRLVFDVTYYLRSYFIYDKKVTIFDFSYIIIFMAIFPNFS